MIKKYFHKNRQLLRVAFLLGLAATVILQSTVLAERCYTIRDSVLRLHILAHSDNSRDQLLKLRVRDALLEAGGELFSATQTKEEALSLTTDRLETLQAVAEQTVRDFECDYAVTLSVEESYFNTRTYDTVTLPAGRYTALRVVIGAGAGQNWWCVMFPPMCLPAATNGAALTEALSQSEADLVQNATKYEIKFKTVEWAQTIAEHFRAWF